VAKVKKVIYHKKYLTYITAYSIVKTHRNKLDATGDEDALLEEK
jgi:hypothetical protein